MNAVGNFAKRDYDERVFFVVRDNIITAFNLRNDYSTVEIAVVFIVNGSIVRFDGVSANMRKRSTWGI